MLKDRIQRIIEIKEKLMDNKEREIEEEKGRLDAANRAIEDVDTRIDQNYQRMTATSISGSDLTVITAYIEYLDKEKYALVVERENIEGKIVLLKEELVELLKENKMLGALRDKVLAALKKSLNRREQKLLDEMALRIDEKKI